MRPKLTFANVISCLALFVALGGSAYAAAQLKKNSVGAKQLKKNAVTEAKLKGNAVTTAKIKDAAVSGAKLGGGVVTTAKLADGAVNGAKVADGSLTGKQVNSSTLATVPTAELANSLPPVEPWHIVGTPGEPPFESEWKNVKAESLRETVGFYKDHEGTVHLKGVAQGAPGAGSIMFHLPPGFRPAENRSVSEVGNCQCGPDESFGFISVMGNRPVEPGASGAVLVPLGSMTISLDAVSFRAES